VDVPDRRQPVAQHHPRPQADPSLDECEALLVEKRASYADPASLAADRELARTLCDALDDLSETLRTTLVLVSIDGLSHAEASEVLGCPEGTVAWRVHEARKKLRAYLDKHGYASRLGDPP
jgi:RNA polymerase sigma-70 factor (ECF subfamily)